MSILDQNNGSRLNILIPDGETPFTLSVINSLSIYKNLQIHIISQKKWVESRFSKNITSFSFIKNITQEIELKEYLSKVIKEKQIDVLLPVSFSLIRFISKYKATFLELNLHIILATPERLDIANSKWKLSVFLEKNQLPVPKTFLLKNIKLNELSGFNYPLLLKPLSNWNGNEILKINNSVDLVNSLQIVNKDKEYIIQEYIIGQDFCVNVLCKQGEIMAFTMQKGILPHSNPFQPHLGCEFIYNEKLYAIIEQVILKLNWSGVANFDIRYNKEENQFYIIEINPRFWGSLEASTSVGVNFPYLLCCISSNIPFEVPKYKYEEYINNRGVVRLIRSKLLFKKPDIKSIQNSSIALILKDPLPKIFKYLNKSIRKITLNKIKLS